MLTEEMIERACKIISQEEADGRGFCPDPKRFEIYVRTAARVFEAERAQHSSPPQDLLHKAMAVKTLLKFSEEAEWSKIIADAIFIERMEERKRCKLTISELTEIHAKIAERGGYGLGFMTSDAQARADMIADMIRNFRRYNAPPKDTP